MQYHENDSRHPRHREHQHEQRREERQPYQEDRFNDFKSRWGEPAPIFSRRNEWHSHEDNHPPGEGRLHNRNDWQSNQHRQEYDDRQREYQDRPPIWRQQDVHFHSSNQHANDRWQQDPSMSNPNHRHDRQLPRDNYWDDSRRR